MFKRNYSGDIGGLNFGMMIEIEHNSGSPEVEGEYAIDTIILKLVGEADDYIVTKHGRLLMRGDRYELIDPDREPLKKLYLPPLGELAYWTYGFEKEILVPISGDNFELLFDYPYSGKKTIPMGTRIEYRYTLITPYKDEQHDNLIRYFCTQDRKLELNLFAIDCENLLVACNR